MPARLILTTIMILALIAMACGISFNLPTDQIVTGPTQTEEINVAAPDSTDVALELDFAAGELDLKGGAENALVSGTADFNVEELKPTIDTQGDRILVSSGDIQFRGIPRLGDKFVNRWELQLGDMPMALKISAGAYSADLDLGGVALNSLEIDDGAADVHLNFSAPNPAEMGVFNYSTGASSVNMTGLANANFERMIFSSGLGNYTLDFSGELKRDADVSIESGVSQVTISVPEGMRARVVIDGALSNVDFSGGWEKSGSEYVIGSGDGPMITINVDIGAGNLQLRSS